MSHFLALFAVRHAGGAVRRAKLAGQADPHHGWFLAGRRRRPGWPPAAKSTVRRARPARRRREQDRRQRTDRHDGCGARHAGWIHHRRHCQHPCVVSRLDAQDAVRPGARRGGGSAGRKNPAGDRRPPRRQCTDALRIHRARQVNARRSQLRDRRRRPCPSLCGRAVQAAAYDRTRSTHRIAAPAR